MSQWQKQLGFYEPGIDNGRAGDRYLGKCYKYTCTQNSKGTLGPIMESILTLETRVHRVELDMHGRTTLPSGRTNSISLSTHPLS